MTDDSHERMIADLIGNLRHCIRKAIDHDDELNLAGKKLMERAERGFVRELLDCGVSLDRIDRERYEEIFRVVKES